MPAGRLTIQSHLLAAVSL